MQDLDIIIQKSSLEIKRAMAVKLIKLGQSVEIICEILEVTKSFIEKWRAIYNREGTENFATQYKGSQGLLSKEQLGDIISFLSKKETSNVDELYSYILENHNVKFKSKQSYYDILSSAGMSWKKTEKINPKKDDDLIAEKKEIIKKNSKSEGTKFSPGIWSY